MQVTVVLPSAKALPDAGTQTAAETPSTLSVALTENETVAPEEAAASAVMSACGAIRGGVVSVRVMSCGEVVLLLTESVAVQSTTVAPTGKADGALFVTVGEASTRSDTEGEPRATAVLALVASVVIAGGAVRVGAVVSLIVTEEVALALFPAPSRAVHRTSVAPSGKEVGAYESVTVVVETASVAEARVRVGAASGVRGAVASKVCAGGTVIAGAVVSVMFIAKVVVAVFPALSVLVHEIVVAPSANCKPDSGEHKTTVAPSTASFALGATYEPSEPAVEVASIVTASCAEITGAVLSMLVIVMVVVAAFPAASVATKSKLPFAVKRRDEALSVPSFADALTVMS